MKRMPWKTFLFILLLSACGGEREDEDRSIPERLPQKQRAAGQPTRASDVFRDLDSFTALRLDAYCRNGAIEPAELESFLDRAGAVARWIEAHREAWMRADRVQEEAMRKAASKGPGIEHSRGMQARSRYLAGLSVWKETGIEFAVFMTVQLQLRSVQNIDRRGLEAEIAGTRKLLAEDAVKWGIVEETKATLRSVEANGARNVRIYQANRGRIEPVLRLLGK